MPTPFEHAMNQLNRALALSEFSPDFLAQVRHPMRELRVSVPVKMDSGEVRVFEGYRVQFNNWRGPFKGGIRFHQDTDIEEVKALAFWMALKTAVVNQPMGGGKGGVTVNPKELSAGEIQRLSRGWMRAMHENLGPEKDVPAPDVNTTPQIMAWMADEFATLTGDTSGAVITGKPVDAGGSEGRGVATAQGGFYVFEALKERLSLPESCRVAIQGFGNAGQHAARFWTQAGHTVVAVSDSRGGTFQKEGLDVEALTTQKQSSGSVQGMDGTTSITNEELLALEVDVLIPAALEGVITQENAKDVRAKVVFELANGPVTPEADDVLFDRGIQVVPDILANAGGVTVSTFEWEQNLKGEHWSEEDVLGRLEVIMKQEAGIVWERAESLKVDLRRSAFVLALERLQEAMPSFG